MFCSILLAVLSAKRKLLPWRVIDTIDSSLLLTRLLIKVCQQKLWHGCNSLQTAKKNVKRISSPEEYYKRLKVNYFNNLQLVSTPWAGLGSGGDPFVSVRSFISSGMGSQDWSQVTTFLPDEIYRPKNKQGHRELSLKAGGGGHSSSRFCSRTGFLHRDLVTHYIWRCESLRMLSKDVKCEYKQKVFGNTSITQIN